MTRSMASAATDLLYGQGDGRAARRGRQRQLLGGDGTTGCGWGSRCVAGRTSSTAARAPTVSTAVPAAISSTAMAAWTSSSTCRAAADVIASIDGAANDGEAGEGDSITATVESIRGGEGNDTLTGNALANTLYGRGGNDTLTGNAGNDVPLRRRGQRRPQRPGRPDVHRPPVLRQRQRHHDQGPDRRQERRLRNLTTARPPGASCGGGGNLPLCFPGCGGVSNTSRGPRRIRHTAAGAERPARRPRPKRPRPSSLTRSEIFDDAVATPTRRPPWSSHVAHGPSARAFSSAGRESTSVSRSLPIRSSLRKKFRTPPGLTSSS